MRNLIVIFILILLVSCKKNTQCYECSFGIVNGVQRPPERWCGEPDHIFTDDSGNAINSFCQPR